MEVPWAAYLIGFKMPTIWKKFNTFVERKKFLIFSQKG